MGAFLFLSLGLALSLLALAPSEEDGEDPEAAAEGVSCTEPLRPRERQVIRLVGILRG